MMALGGGDLDKMITEVVERTINSTAGADNPLTLDKIIGVKSIQRGVTTVAGNITISSVNMAKSIVLSTSKGSAGSVAARGSLSGSVMAKHDSRTSAGNTMLSGNSSGSWGLSGSISGGGATDLTVKVFSAKIVDASTLSCDGPVEWQVVEYY